jgi:hypothetical protein
MILSLYVTLVTQLIDFPDGGPIYQESLNPGSWLIEPWNSISSLMILLPALYWAWQLRGRYRKFPFLTFCIPLLFLGGLGSTLFHGFRSSPYLLAMDVMPTAILTLSLSIYFWYLMLKKWLWVFIIVISSIVLRLAVFYFIPGQFGVNIAYFITGLMILLPVALYLKQIRFKYTGLIVGSAIFLGLSLVFRRIDGEQFFSLPMGTHFLWHIFSGFGAFMLAAFLYRIRIMENAND